MKGKCEVCGDAAAKYRCPGCEVLTCCLTCVRQHKANTPCSGQRDKTAFVPMNQFKDIHLLSDYRLLEDGGRMKTNCARGTMARKHNIPRYLKELQKNATRRKIDLRILPYPMSRRKNNSTTYQYKSKSIVWQIEWRFPQVDLTLLDKSVPETSTMEQVLARHFGEDGEPVTRHRLTPYTEAGRHSWALFMEVLDTAATQKTYHRLDLQKTVTENLAHKCVIEYPTIKVVLKPHWSDYITDQLEHDDVPAMTVGPTDKDNAMTDGTAPPAKVEENGLVNLVCAAGENIQH